MNNKAEMNPLDLHEIAIAGLINENRETLRQLGQVAGLCSERFNKLEAELDALREVLKNCIPREVLVDAVETVLNDLDGHDPSEEGGER